MARSSGLRFALPGVIALASVSVGQDRFDPIRKKAEALIVDQKIPAISIAIAQDGKIVWEGGFGWADREKRQRATADTIYNIGSTSKPITAAAIMMLAEDGKLNIDLPANRYLPENARLRSPFGDVEKLTVRRLLDHTSGLSRHSQILTGDEVRFVPAIDETIRRYGKTTKPVGEAFEYSNLGYAILSRIVSTASGLPFGESLRRRIFSPLGMKNSTLGKPRTLNVATAYGPDRKPVRDVLSDTPGAADVYSTAHDVALFGMLLAGDAGTSRSTLSAVSLTEMRKPSADRGVSKYGLGLESVQIGKYNLVFHHGSNGYGTSLFAILPEQKVSVSILSNITTSQTGELLNEILKLLVPDYEEKLNAFRSAPRANETSPYRPSEEYLGHWKGTITTWKEEIPVEMWFQPDGDIHVQMKGGYRHLLNGVRIEQNYLRGSFQDDVGTEDARRHRSNLHLKLKLRGSSLDGAVTSSSVDPQGIVLSSWIKLEKQKTGQ